MPFSRVSAIQDKSSGTILESYLYLGLGTIVAYNHPEPNVNLSYFQLTTGLPDGGVSYSGLDRFGRVIDQNWVHGSTSTDRFQFGMTGRATRSTRKTWWP